jgi:hypothetical protein
MALAEKTQSQGKHIILVAPGNETDASRQNFAFASYLLISNGKSAFRYSSEINYSQVWLYNNYEADLGTPLGPRYQSGSLWRRDFTKGYVIVDPVNHIATLSTDSSPTPTSTQTVTTLPTTSPTPVTPTATPTAIVPTSTPIQPTATSVVLPSNTPTRVVPTASNTLLPATPTLTRTPIPATPVSEKIFDDKNPILVYSSSWQSISTSKAYNGSYKETTRSGATVTFPFTGQSFSIIYKGGITFSKFDVYVDGALVGTLNQKLSAATYQQRWDYPGQLPFGNHTLKLVFKVTSSTINRGSLDAVIVR